MTTEQKAAELVAQLDSQYKRVLMENVIQIDDHDSSSDFFEDTVEAARRLKKGRFEVAYVAWTWQMFEHLGSELEEAINKQIGNAGWIIPPESAGYEKNNESLVFMPD